MILLEVFVVKKKKRKIHFERNVLVLTGVHPTHSGVQVIQECGDHGGALTSDSLRLPPQMSARILTHRHSLLPGRKEAFSFFFCAFVHLEPIGHVGTVYPCEPGTWQEQCSHTVWGLLLEQGL